MLALLQLFATYAPRCGPRPALRPRSSASLAAEAGALDAELLAYWSAHGAAWQAPLRKLDVRAAWSCGELDGVLPSGRASRVAGGERLLTLARALELFESDELQVRRRFRSMTAEDMAPRWSRVVDDRAALQASGRWEEVVVESDAARRFARARLEGSVEEADASPALSRAMVTVLSPALKAAARQRDKADGGLELSLARLMSDAGVDPAERWLTAKLLAEIDAEIDSLPAARPAPPSRWASGAAGGHPSSTGEAERDVGQAASMGAFGVAAALAVLLLQMLARSGGGGGGAQSGLEATLDLMR